MNDTITLDADTCRKIGESKEPIRILDPNGNEVGCMLANPPEDPLELDGTELTEDDVRQALADPRRYTTEQVLRLLED